MGTVADLSRDRRGELLRFLATGLAAYVTDVMVFNVLLLAFGTSSAAAKIVSSVVAIAVAFAGSRWFTWPDRRSSAVGREYALFVLVSVLAAGLQLACLLVSRHVLDARSALADNVSANVVGMVLATAFRFWGFRTLVFPAPRQAVGTQV